MRTFTPVVAALFGLLVSVATAGAIDGPQLQQRINKNLKILCVCQDAGDASHGIGLLVPGNFFPSVGGKTATFDCAVPVFDGGGNQINNLYCTSYIVLPK
jgi:hypothetical protein